jgi:hypothetical protein
MKRSLVILAFVAAGCNAPTSTDTGSAAAALDSTESGSTSGALLASNADSTSDAMASATVTPESVSAAAAARWPARFQPAGCATATASGATVTLQLHDCTGPYGLVHVTGSVEITYSASPNGLTAVAHAAGLDVNGATLDLDATAVFTGGPTRTLTVQSTGSGVGARGTAISHSGSYTITSDGSCLTVDGAWMTTIGRDTWSTQVTGYKRCSGQCPEAGGTIVWHGGISNVTVTITFDGTAAAKWSTSRGASGTVNLDC